MVEELGLDQIVKGVFGTDYAFRIVDFILSGRMDDLDVF